jgi:hypothetical protein
MADFNPDTYIAEKTAPASGGFDPDAYIAEKTAPAPDDTPAIIKAGKNIWSGIKKSSADADAQKTMPEYLLHMVGGAVGNLMNIPVEAAKAAYSYVPLNIPVEAAKAAYSYVPQAVKTPIESEVKGVGEAVKSNKTLSDFLLGAQQWAKGVGEAVKSNKTLSDFLLGAQQWAKDNPRAVGNIGAAVNVASVLPVGKAVEAAGKGIADIAGPAVEKAAAAIVDKIPTATDKLDKAIQTGVTKGIKPTVIGKPSYDKLTNFYDKANQAVKVIAENREKLNLVDENGEALHHPRSAAETLQAINQTEKVIYDKYHAMATAAGDAGSEFGAEPILKELDKIAADPEEALPMGDPRLKYNPQTRAYANDLKSEIMELHGASPEIIEARIADLNNSLKGFYDGRVTKAKAQIDGSVAKLMRQQLDNNITSAVGEGYQDLKNQYGALKTIENEVAKRALVNARKANKGVADLTDIFTGGDLVAGTLSGNPALIAKGLFGRGIKEVYKSLNNPDRYIEKMFKKAYDVVPSGKDVELVKNAVAGVKPLPGPDIVQWANEAGKVELKKKGVSLGNLFNNHRSGAIGGSGVKLSRDAVEPTEKYFNPDMATQAKDLGVTYKGSMKADPEHGVPVDYHYFQDGGMDDGTGSFPVKGSANLKDVLDQHRGNFAKNNGKDAYDYATGANRVEKSQDQKDITAAKRYFGTTTEPKFGGYIVPDGSMLDLSGRRQGNTYATSRALDHREIGYAVKDNLGGTEGMRDFMRKGNIRMDYNSGAFDLEKAPSDAQKNTLKKLINSKDEIRFELMNGQDRFYKEYDSKNKAQALSDIDNFYSGKLKQNESLAQRFHVSGGGLFDNMRPGSIGSALGIKPKVDNLGFYSNAEKAVNDINMPKAPADQWAAMLDPAKGKGTKADETKVLPMLGLTGATAGAIGAGGVTLEKVLHKKDEHGQSFADILKGIVDNMQGGK